MEAESLDATWELENVEKSIKNYEQVTHIVPDFAPGWSGLANAEVVMAYYSSSDTLLNKE